MNTREKSQNKRVSLDKKEIWYGYFLPKIMMPQQSSQECVEHSLGNPILKSYLAYKGKNHIESILT